VQLKDTLMIAARNAMQNPAHATQLNLLQTLRGYGQMVQAQSKHFAGDALYRKVIAEAVAEAKRIPKLDPKACFAAGTMVHTPNGLVPIQDLKVGDWVLSKPENGTGDVAPKRVLKTFRTEQQKVRFLAVYPPEWVGEQYDSFAVTESHPFWQRDAHYAKTYSWRAIGTIGQGHSLVDIAGGEYIIEVQEPLYIVEGEPDMAWFEVVDGSGKRVEMRDGQLSIDWESEFVNNPVDKWWDPQFEVDAHHFHTTVFNIEVEDFHTYFVGRYGVWVHNTKGGNLTDGGTSKVEIIEGIVPTGKARVYHLESEFIVPNKPVALPGEDVGTILVLTTRSRTITSPDSRLWSTGEKFQLLTEGSRFNAVELRFEEWARRFVNPNPNGRPFVKMGDGRATQSQGTFTATFCVVDFSKTR
jgi:hypothetical protein